VQMETSRRSTICAIAALSSVLVIPVNHFAVTWWRTLHQDRSLARLAPQSKLDGEFIVAMLIGLLAMTLIYAWLLVHRVAVERLEEEVEVDSLERAIEQRRAEAGVPA
jgi:heme exporter protein C